MSFLETARRALSTKADEYFDDREYEDAYDEYEEAEPKKNLFSFLSKRNDEDYEEEYEEDNTGYRTSTGFTRSYTARTSSSERFRGSQTTQPAPRANLSGVEVTVHYPETFDDATKIIREVKANKITIFDISTITSDDEARRVVDYIGGAAEGMECPFKRLCPSIFCIAPSGVSFDLKKRY